jgi:hypothetical protein
MKKLSHFLCPALLGLLLTAGGAKAGVSWTYDSTPGTPNVVSDTGNNYLDFSNQPLLPATGTSDIVVTNITVRYPVTGSSDNFTHQNYSLKVLFTDTDSGASHQVIFSGDLNGTVKPQSSLIVNTFDPLHTVDEFMLGNNHYKVTIGPYTPPGPANSATKGSIGAHVEVTPGNGDDNHDSPEPSTMLLAGLGAIGFGLRSWRKRQAKA